MKNSDTTKVTFKINEDLLISFNNHLDRCFIKRDSFINNLISVETKNLETELKALPKKLSPEGHKYLVGCLKRSGAKPINVVIEKVIIEKLNDVIKKYGLSRDSFMNRLLLLMRLDDITKKNHDLPLRMSNIDDDIELSTTPLTAIEGILNDPLVYLRCYSELGLYTDPLHHFIEHGLRYQNNPEDKKKWEKALGLWRAASCYIEDVDIPCSDEFKERKSLLDNPPSL